MVQPVNPVPDPPVRGTVRWVASFPNGTRFTNPASPGVVFVRRGDGVLASALGQMSYFPLFELIDSGWELMG